MVDLQLLEVNLAGGGSAQLVQKGGTGTSSDAGDGGAGLTYGIYGTSTAYDDYGGCGKLN